MLRLTPRQRELVADKMPEMANIVACAIAIGFMIGEPRVSWPVLVAGMALWAGTLIVAVLVVEGKA